MLSLAAGGMIMPQRLALLTPREYEIAVLVSKGLCNKRIARELCISVGVVKLHLHRAYRKAGVRGRTQLAVHDYTGSARPMLSLAAGGMIMPQRLALLTPREYEIAVLVSKGLCNKRIARELCISVGVVKLHLHRAYRKAGVRGRTQLAVLVVSSQKEAA